MEATISSTKCHFLRVWPTFARSATPALHDALAQVPFSKGMANLCEHATGCKANGYLRCHFLRVWPTFARTSSSAIRITERAIF